MSWRDSLCIWRLLRGENAYKQHQFKCQECPFFFIKRVQCSVLFKCHVIQLYFKMSPGVPNCAGSWVSSWCRTVSLTSNRKCNRCSPPLASSLVENLVLIKPECTNASGKMEQEINFSVAMQEPSHLREVPTKKSAFLLSSKPSPEGRSDSKWAFHLSSLYY